MATNIDQFKSHLGVISTPDQTIMDAVKLMAENKTGLLVVCGEKGQLAGVLSERDVIRVLGNSGAQALDSKVGEVMTRDVATCEGSVHPHDVLSQMYERKIRHMPVLNDGVLKGVASSRDILEYLAKHASPDEQAMMWAKLFQL